MNERIRALALQAGGSHYPDVGGELLEKFALLVAQRCAAIYEAIDNGNAVHGTMNYVQALRREFEVK